MMPIARVLTADPAWLFGDSLPGATRGASRQYECMSTEAISKLRIPPTEPDAILFLWRVASMPGDALDVVREWGFTPKSELVWVKLTRGADERVLKQDLVIPKGTPVSQIAEHLPLHFGMGRIVRGAHESCIVATRGRASVLVKHLAQRSVFFAPVQEHSRKPEAFFQIVEKLAPGPYVELFARYKRRGWTTLGSDLGVRLERRPA